MAVSRVTSSFLLRNLIYCQSKCISPTIVHRSLRPCVLIPYSQKPSAINFISTSSALQKDKPKTKVKVQKSDDKELGQYVDIEKLRTQLQGEVEKLKQYFVQQLSTRSSVSLVENLKIEFEGETYELQDLAQVAKKGKYILAVNMAGFPQASVVVMKALRASSLSLNPSQDGTLITVQLPRISKEHRENLAKLAKAAYFECKKVMDRSVDSYYKEAKKDNLSKDEESRVLALLRLLENEYLQAAETALKTKQEELKLEE